MSIDRTKPDYLNYDNNAVSQSEDARKELKSDATKRKREEDAKNEDLYDLDLQIKDLAFATLPADTVQSEWPRCSRVCQTIRGHTCPSCDTQQVRQTCIRC